MSRIGKLFGIFSSKTDPGRGARREPGLGGADWQAIRTQVQAEVRGLVSKSIVESIYRSQPGSAYEDREVLLQAAANRLYADALYEISRAGKKPPFKPSKEILKWVRDALEETVTGWQLDGAGNGDHTPTMEAKRATTDAIFAALERASQNAVLQEAAKQRVQAETAMVAAE